VLTGPPSEGGEVGHHAAKEFRIGVPAEFLDGGRSLGQGRYPIGRDAGEYVSGAVIEDGHLRTLVS
jgi:hypothetical protein